MHGTNGLPEEVSKECIRHGISKVNVNKSVWRGYLSHLKANASTMTLTKLMEEGVDAAQKLLEWQMDVCGSTGKA
jgi:fructose-bisphosphate aldolase class II